MKIHLKEPVSPRYIYINPETNRVHLMVPIVSGTSIGLDNTCKTVYSLQEFFGKGSTTEKKSAVYELTQYKDALRFDLSLMTEETTLKQEKRDRLEQINHYIDALTSLSGNQVLDNLNGGSPDYPEPLQALMRDDASNLYSMHLRPIVQDHMIRTHSPIFSLNRKNDGEGNPDSVFYTTLVERFKNLLITPWGAHARLVNAILATTEATHNDFTGIQRVLHETVKALFNVEVDFNQSDTKETVTQDFVTNAMAFNDHSLYIRRERPNPIEERYYNHYLFINGQELLYIHRNGDVETVNIHDMDQFNDELVKINPKQFDEIDIIDEQIKELITSNGGHAPPEPTAAEHVDALLGYCAPTLFNTHTESPFYAAKTAEELVILTQFFMAHINIYCVSHTLSTLNFGEILDGSKALSQKITERLLSAKADGLSIEDTLIDCINDDQTTFQLTRPLMPDEAKTITTQFIQHYAQIKDSPHFDEFVVLNTHQQGLFVTHQASICTDFSEIAREPLSAIDSDYFKSIREDYKRISSLGVLPHKNEHINVTIEIDPFKLEEAQLVKLLPILPLKNRLQLLKAIPALLLRLHVARGEQNEADSLLQNSPEIAQKLLLMPGVFTDYSGRTFNCTAYEYAYWAKDKHMCRMLEQRMDPQTKEAMLNRIDNLEQDGLTYEQHDQVISHSKHFDVTPLKTALEHYISNFRELWRKEHRLSITDEGDVIPQNRVLKAAWLDIGCQQRELPVHVINEYCRKDPLFSASTFNEDHLPRVLTFKGDDIDDGAFFPINSSGSWIPEVHFTLRGLAGVSGEDLIGAGGRLQRDVFPETINKELSALSRLDEVRSADLKQSRENLASNHLLRPL